MSCVVSLLICYIIIDYVQCDKPRNFVPHDMSHEYVLVDSVQCDINQVPMTARNKAEKDMMSPIVPMIVFHPASAASVLGKVTDVCATHRDLTNH